ncbi:MAG: exodeoxyribonuclease III [Gammaproteobacteria bacterium]|nr:exodeoxyribonuclease III [Gammaproteobacteria bacterium]
MYFVSFNINSIRARIPQLDAIVEQYLPAVIGLQETKVQDIEFPITETQRLGYQTIFHGQKGHYGVALMTNLPIIKEIKGLPRDSEDAQRRLVGAKLQLPCGDTMTVFNGYFPQGENIDHETKFPAKRDFYAGLTELLKTEYQKTDHLVVMGDINVAAQDIDIGIGEDNRKRWLKTGKASFQPVERQWLNDLRSFGLTDSYRWLHPDATDYSWFDYRSKGFERDPIRGLRIDQILLTQSLLVKCKKAGIDYKIRGMEKPSDHCPIFVELSDT